MLEFATPPAGELEVFREYPNEREIRLGVVNPKTNTINDTQYVYMSKLLERVSLTY